MSRLLIVFALAACGPPDPLNTEVATPVGAVLAIEGARAEWSGRLDTDLPETTPEIRWFSGECLRYEGEPATVCVGGRTWHSPMYDTEIHGLRDHAAVVIAHELLHWALLESSGDPEPEHDGPHWSEVSDVQADVEANLAGA